MLTGADNKNVEVRAEYQHRNIIITYLQSKHARMHTPRRFRKDAFLRAGALCR